MKLDLRERKYKKTASITCGVKLRCGVICDRGCWSGYRQLEVFVYDSQPSVNVSEVTDAIKGKDSYPNCPRCKGPVLMTHVTGSGPVF